MEPTPEVFEQFKVDLAKAKTFGDLMGKDGALKKLMGKALQTMLEAELNEELGSEKPSSEGKNTGNCRNCKRRKTLINDNGERAIRVT